MTPALRIQDLRKIYPPRLRFRDFLPPWKKDAPVEALRGVDLEVPRGSIFGLLGPNGAGKTTLLKILATMILPDGGAAEVCGQALGRGEREVKRRIGWVASDERSFYWRLTGRQNLEFFGRLHGLSGAVLRDRVSEALAHLDLGREADRPFSGYSSGMKQRLAVARGLLHDPEVLLLDEPTRSLDPAAAHALRLLLRERMNRALGKTIVLSTHNLSEAAFLCDRLALLHAGRILRSGPPREVLAGAAGRRFRVRLEGSEPVAVDEADLPSVLAAAMEAGSAVLSVAEEAPPLEEIFAEIVRRADG